MYETVGGSLARSRPRSSGGTGSTWFPRMRLSDMRPTPTIATWASTPQTWMWPRPCGGSRLGSRRSTPREPIQEYLDPSHRCARLAGHVLTHNAVCGEYAFVFVRKWRRDKGLL